MTDEITRKRAAEIVDRAVQSGTLTRLPGGRIIETERLATTSDDLAVALLEEVFAAQREAEQSLDDACQAAAYGDAYGLPEPVARDGEAGAYVAAAVSLRRAARLLDRLAAITNPAMDGVQDVSDLEAWIRENWDPQEPPAYLIAMARA